MGGGKVPDAWDDDWIEKADVRSSSQPPISYVDGESCQSPAPANEAAPKPVKLSKAERRAKQAEFNRQIWQDA